MAKFKVVFESKEKIPGLIPETRDWIEYECILRVKDGGKTPVSLDMTFIPPHPFIVNMPLVHTIKSDSITGAYLKLVRFLKKYGVEFRG